MYTKRFANAWSVLGATIVACTLARAMSWPRDMSNSGLSGEHPGTRSQYACWSARAYVRLKQALRGSSAPAPIGSACRTYPIRMRAMRRRWVRRSVPPTCRCLCRCTWRRIRSGKPQRTASMWQRRWRQSECGQCLPGTRSRQDDRNRGHNSFRRMPLKPAVTFTLTAMTGSVGSTHLPQAQFWYR